MSLIIVQIVRFIWFKWIFHYFSHGIESILFLSAYTHALIMCLKGYYQFYELGWDLYLLKDSDLVR